MSPYRDWDGIVTRPRAGRPRNRGLIPGRDRPFRLALGPPASFSVGTKESFLRLKLPKREADYSPQFSGNLSMSGRIV
jgi:hypothetical protein